MPEEHSDPICFRSPLRKADFGTHHTRSLFDKDINQISCQYWGSDNPVYIRQYLR